MRSSSDCVPRYAQKRYYIDGAIYFITTATIARYPYFLDDIICDLMVEQIWLAQRLMKFQIYAYAIMPDHIHLLIQPQTGFNYSNIMFQ